MDRVLAGRYALEKVIGEGGMAAVWRARDTRLDRFVAVKLMEERLSSDAEFRARFLQEARAAASFSHPNVVDVLDYGEEDGVPYIVMELVEGEDLRSLIDRQRRLPSDEVARIGAEVARGLAAAHRRGLVHRDIKPANILLADDGTPKLADFGIARALGTATNTKAGTMLGSVHYLSPEQVQGTAVDARSDLYSLGVVLYEAATGRRPFDDDAPAAIAVQRLNETPLPPHAVEPTLPQWLSNVIERAMQRLPERRYASASELERDLRARRAAPPQASLEDTVAQPVPMGGATAAGVPRARTRPRPAPSQSAFVLPLIVALALVGLGAYLVFAEQAFAVPVVEGKERNEAREILLRQGLRVDVVCCDPSDKPKNVVWKQEPRPPTLVRPGDTVTIYISEGPGLITIPPLRGRTVDEANQILERIGLKRGNTFQQPDDSVAAGRVIQSEPSAGASVPSGFVVDLIVSTGPRPTPTPTPTPVPTPTPTPAPTPTPTLTLPIPTPRR